MLTHTGEGRILGVSHVVAYCRNASLFVGDGLISCSYCYKHSGKSVHIWPGICQGWICQKCLDAEYDRAGANIRCITIFLIDYQVHIAPLLLVNI